MTLMVTLCGGIDWPPSMALFTLMTMIKPEPNLNLRRNLNKNFNNQYNNIIEFFPHSYQPVSQYHPVHSELIPFQ